MNVEIKNLEKITKILVTRDSDGYFKREDLMSLSIEDMLRILMPSYSQDLSNFESILTGTPCVIVLIFFSIDPRPE